MEVLPQYDRVHLKAHRFQKSALACDVSRASKVKAFLMFHQIEFHFELTLLFTLVAEVGALFNITEWYGALSITTIDAGGKLGISFSSTHLVKLLLFISEW